MGEPHTAPYDEELAELLGLPAPEPEEPARQVPPGQRVQVQVDMRHLRNYGRESKVHLSYGCTFPVALGDQVRVPPPPQDQRWLVGTVVGLGYSDYTGPVRDVRPMEEEA